MTPASPYPVERVEPEWKLDREAMGTKDKFWYRESRSQNRWLFKFPRKETGEHWAEKIAAEIAAILNVDHAIVELAKVNQDRGSATEEFTEERFELHHGNELLARKLSGYDKAMKFGQTQHMFDNIMQTLERIFKEEKAAKKMCQNFSGYLILDAIIGNTDRHHENWGILVERIEDRYRGRLAPSFDHASSLGRELQDQKRQQWLNEGWVGHYSERGRGGIYWAEADSRAPAPLELVRRAARDYPSLFDAPLKRAAGLDEGRVAEAVKRIPDGWMSAPARKFAVALVHYNLCELRKLVR